jgi:hypothetical protein
MRCVIRSEVKVSNFPDGTVFEVKQHEESRIICLYYVVSRGRFVPFLKSYTRIGPVENRRQKHSEKFPRKKTSVKKETQRKKTVRKSWTPSKVVVYDKEREEVRGSGGRVISEELHKTLKRSKMPRTYTIEGEIEARKRGMRGG